MSSPADSVPNDITAHREVSDALVRLAWRTGPDDEVAALARATRFRRYAAALVMGAAGLVALRAGMGTSGLGRLWASSSVALVLVSIVYVLWLRPRHRVRARWRRHEASPGVQEFVADRGGARHTVGGWRTTYAWSAVQRIVVGRTHIFLHLSATEALTIPRRAFGPQAEERRALESLRVWQQHPTEAVTAPEADEGRTEFALRYVLRPRDFTAFVQAVQQRDQRVQPLWVLAGTGLLAALWVVAPMSEGLFALTNLWFPLVFAAVFGLLGLAPFWMPRLVTPGMVRTALWLDPARLPVGDVDLRVGPAGGWSSSSRGVSRFAWSDVSTVLEGDGVVVLLFGPLTGVVVPDRALGTDRAAFVARCRSWLGEPAAPPRQNPPRRPPGPPPDPYAPPEAIR